MSWFVVWRPGNWVITMKFMFLRRRHKDIIKTSRLLSFCRDAEVVPLRWEVFLQAFPQLLLTSHCFAQSHSHTRRLTTKQRRTRSVPTAEGKKAREKKKSIAGDSGARRRIVSCQNNILPSSPADRCGGLGTEGSLSPPLLRLSFFLSLSLCPPFLAV